MNTHRNIPVETISQLHNYENYEYSSIPGNSVTVLVYGDYMFTRISILLKCTILNYI